MTAPIEPPFNLEAEENLLCVCMLEGGADTVRLCVEKGITPASFYSPKNTAVFDAIMALYDKNEPIEQATVAIELKRTNRMPEPDIYPTLGQICQRVPTTMRAQIFVDTVADLANRRDKMRFLSFTIGQLADTTTSTENVSDSIVTYVSGGVQHRPAEMPWDDLLSFDSKHDPDSLLGDRFACRTDGIVIVAPSGVGKSVLSLQLGACCALGRPLLGLRVAAPLRVLYVQAEDSRGDVAEAAQGFVRGYGLTDDDLRQLKEGMRIVRWNDVSGNRFLARLRWEFKRHPFDVVIINPLYSFFGGDVSDQKEMSLFLRNGLNPILNETRAIGIIVHHTTKVKDDGKDKGASGNVEASYHCAGSSELTNWARGIINLQQVKGSHAYRMLFSKRGARAGLVDVEGKTTTSVLIEHSKQGLCWLPSNWRPETNSKGKFTAKFDVARAAQVYDAKMDWSENEQAIALDQGITRKTVQRHRQQILDTVP